MDAEAPGATPEVGHSGGPLVDRAGRTARVPASPSVVTVRLDVHTLAMVVTDSPSYVAVSTEYGKCDGEFTRGVAAWLDNPFAPASTTCVSSVREKCPAVP